MCIRDRFDTGRASSNRRQDSQGNCAPTKSEFAQNI